MERLAKDVQDAAGENVTTLYADQGYTGHAAAAVAKAHGMELVVVGMKEARRGFVLLPKRWLVERSFAWASRFRRLARDHERLPEVYPRPSNTSPSEYRCCWASSFISNMCGATNAQS